MTDIDMNVDFVSGYRTVDEDDYVISMYSKMSMLVLGSATDGLWDVSADIVMTDEYGYGTEGEEEYDSDSTTMGASYVETAEEDGSVTGTVGLYMESEYERYDVSFDLNVAAGADIADLPAEGDNVVALTENTEDEGYMRLSADLMNLYADAMELLADEGIMQLVTMFSGPVEETVDEAVID